MSEPTKSPDPIDEAKVTAIDAWLPQTQCTQCSYPRCRDYAVAIANGEADINQCPPGGDITIRGLAALLGKMGKPLNPKFGIHQPRTVAVIDESTCIGCVMCIKPCPTDAIVGSAKKMHTVISRDCTGCELCIAPCPVDCITMEPVTDIQSELHWRWPEYSPEGVELARLQTNNKLSREAKREQSRSASKKLKELSKVGSADIKLDIAAAVKRVQQNKR